MVFGVKKGPPGGLLCNLLWALRRAASRVGVLLGSLLLIAIVKHFVMLKK